jgi:ketosteroid isomerase-like protein
MGQAREVLDRVTRAVMSNDVEALKELYAQDAVMETSDQGKLRGRDAAVTYLAGFAKAFPDASWEPIAQHEAGDTAVDEGYFVGTHTGALEAPTGESIPATGRRLRLRECDVATVRDGRVTSHRFYFDQVDFLNQLGLKPEG